MMGNMEELYGGIELGGTKTICAIGTASGELIAQTIIPTTTADETLGAVYHFFELQGLIKALGVGTFGPLNLDATSPLYGTIYNTPKVGWADVALKSLLETHLNVTVAVDLDVNCAALGELYFGEAKGVDSFVYMTLGTGIGGALVIDRRIVHGVLHLEMGHMRIPHEVLDGFAGACPFHGDCLEGIASGHAMELRYGQKPKDIVSQEVWAGEASYIAHAVINIMMMLGPEKIVLGGGLTNQPGLIELIRTLVEKNVNKYLPFPDTDTYIVCSSGSTNGVRGAISLAALAAQGGEFLL